MTTPSQSKIAVKGGREAEGGFIDWYQTNAEVITQETKLFLAWLYNFFAVMFISIANESANNSHDEKIEGGLCRLAGRITRAK
jgi:hypothetical protein